MFRNLLTEPGLVEWTSDFRIHYNIVLERTFWVYTWHPYVFDTDNAPTISMSIVYSLFLMAPSSETAQRLMIVSVYVVMFTNMSMVFFLWFRSRFREGMLYVSSLLSGLLYTLNPWVAAESIHWFVLWNYAWSPALLFLAYRAARAPSRRKVLTSSILSGVIFTILGNAHGIVFGLVLVGLFLFVYVASQQYRIRETVKRSIVYLVSTVSLMLAFSSYWLVPFTLQYSSQITSGPSWVSYSPNDLTSVSRNLSIIDGVRLQYPLSYNLLSSVLPSSAVTLSYFLSWLVPLMAILGVIAGRRESSITSIAVIGTIFLFLSKGTGPPLGQAYFYLGTQAPLLSNFGWVLFRPAYLYTGLVALCFSILAGYAMGSIGFSVANGLAILRKSMSNVGTGLFARVLKFSATSGKAILLLLLIIGIFLNGWPLLTGDLGGYMYPVQLPSDYIRMNNWLASQADDSRTAWLPPSSRVIWSPYQQIAPLQNRDELSPLPVWASAKPVLGLGVTYQFPARARIFPQFFAQNALQRNLTSWVGKVYGIANVGYLIYHSDTVDQSSFAALDRGLQNQQDLSLAYSDGPLSVYRNADNLQEVQAIGNSILVLGGFDSYLDAAGIQGYNPIAYPSIFLEQSPLSIQQLTSYVSYSDALMIFGPKNLDDLVLSSIGSDYYVAPQDTLKNTWPVSAWDKDFFYSNLWVPARLDGLSGIKFDPDLGKQILLTSQVGANTEASFTTTESGLYDAWVRVLLSPSGGSLAVGVDGTSWTLGTISDELTGFKWIRVSSEELTSGSHTLTITNNSGFNAVNLVAIVPRHIFEEREGQVANLIRNTRIIYANDDSALGNYPNKADFDQVSVANTTTGWSVGNGVGTFALDETDSVGQVPSVVFSGSSDSEGNFYSWYVPPVPLDVTHRDTLRFWVKTDVDVARFRVYLQDTSNNFRQFFISLTRGSWHLVSLNLNNYFSESPSPLDLRSVEAINFGLTGNSSTPYSMKLGDIYVSNYVTQWNLALMGQGDYTLAVEGAPASADSYTRITIGNQKFDLNFSQTSEHYIQFTHAASNTSIVVSSHHIQHLALFVYQAHDGTSSLSTIFRSRIVPSISGFRKIDPTHWNVEVNATSPFLLEFGEAQSSLWHVTDSVGNVYPGVTLNSITNGFWIGRAGLYHLTLEYSSQKSLQQGVILSLSSFLLTIFLYSFTRYPFFRSIGRKRRLDKNK